MEEKSENNISIIIPVYNSSKYLIRCVESVLRQSFHNFEVILVDDGSTDESGHICDEYEEKDCRIRVIHQTNQGQSVARNNAVKVASGEWIMFVDSDDIVHQKIVEQLYKAVFTFPQANMAVCRRTEDEEVPADFFNVLTDKAYLVPSSESTLLNFYKDGQYYWTVWAKLIKKEIIQKYPFTEGKYYEDNAVVCKWLYESTVIAVVPQSLYFYQINPKGTTKGDISYKYFDFLWAMEEQIRFYDSVGYSQMIVEALKLYFGSYEDRMNHTVFLPRKTQIRKKITRDAIGIWRKYRKRYPIIKNEWRHVLLVAFPILIRLRKFGK